MERWRTLDRTLKDLAVMAAAATIGCAWCLDFGYWEQLGKHLSEAELVELTAIIAVENLRSRMNSALGLTAQGFKDRCELQPAGGKAGAAQPSAR